MTRAHSAIGFAALFLCCLAGAFDANPWFVCAATATLVLLSLNQRQDFYGRYVKHDRFAAQSMLLLGSTLNAGTAAIIAYGLGGAIGWLWGIN